MGNPRTPGCNTLLDNSLVSLGFPGNFHGDTISRTVLHSSTAPATRTTWVILAPLTPRQCRRVDV